MGSGLSRLIMKNAGVINLVLFVILWIILRRSDRKIYGTCGKALRRRLIRARLLGQNVTVGFQKTPLRNEHQKTHWTQIVVITEEIKPGLWPSACADILYMYVGG